MSADPDVMRSRRLRRWETINRKPPRWFRAFGQGGLVERVISEQYSAHGRRVFGQIATNSPWQRVWVLFTYERFPT